MIKLSPWYHFHLLILALHIIILTGLVLFSHVTTRLNPVASELAVTGIVLRKKKSVGYTRKVIIAMLIKFQRFIIMDSWLYKVNGTVFMLVSHQTKSKVGDNNSNLKLTETEVFFLCSFAAASFSFVRSGRQARVSRRVNNQIHTERSLYRDVCE